LAFQRQFFHKPRTLLFSERTWNSGLSYSQTKSQRSSQKEIMDHKLHLVKNLQHGECTFRQKEELVALTWKDKKPVHLIFGCPVGIKLYNASMGGVDQADQRISSYKKHFKTCTWHLAPFFHGLEQCCLNSFISMQATPGQNAKCTQLTCRALLSKQLIGGRTYVKGEAEGLQPLFQQKFALIMIFTTW